MSTYKILNGKSGITAELTTESTVSHYGLPVLRMRGKSDRCEFPVGTPDMGPSDFLPTGIRAAEFVRRWAQQIGEDFSEEEGAENASNMLPCDADGHEAAHRFLAQWPEGPQVPSAKEVVAKLFCKHN